MIRNFEHYWPTDVVLYCTTLHSSETVSFRGRVDLKNVAILEAGSSSTYLPPLTFDVRRLRKRAKINLLTPNVNYSGRTAPLTSKVAFYIFIQQI